MQGVMTSFLMSSPPISISHQLFRCRYSNSRDVVAIYPSFSCTATRVPRRAGSCRLPKMQIFDCHLLRNGFSQPFRKVPVMCSTIHGSTGKAVFASVKTSYAIFFSKFQNFQLHWTNLKMSQLHVNHC